jgi:transposase
MTTLMEKLVPDELWKIVESLLPPRRHDPRGGRPRQVPDRNCLAGIIYMARASIPWELLPAKELGCGSYATCWRRFAEWTEAGVWDALHLVLLDRLGADGRLDWSRVLVDTSSLRAKRGGPHGRKSGRPCQEREQAPPGHRCSGAAVGDGGDRRQRARLGAV